MTHSRLSATLLFLATMVVGTAQAQETATPTYLAPNRAFQQHELGATISFPDPADVAFEAHGRYGFERVDVGLRLGLWEPETNLLSTAFIIGASARAQVLTHTADFPLDGSINFGLGAMFGDFDAAFIPVGLSVGRRLTIEDSEVSILPYAQPTIMYAGGPFDEGFFGLGLGADFRLSRVFDARISLGFGDELLEGFAVSAVWVR